MRWNGAAAVLIAFGFGALAVVAWQAREPKSPHTYCPAVVAHRGKLMMLLTTEPHVSFERVDAGVLVIVGPADFKSPEPWTKPWIKAMKLEGP